MRMHFGLHPAVLALCLSLGAGAAFAADGPQTPPAPSPASAVPPPPNDAGTPAVPNPPNIDQATLQADLKAARQAARQAHLDVARQAALQARMEAVRSRMEADAQQLAVLSAQMAGPMMQRYAIFGPPHALIGVQLGRSSGQAGARVREVSPGGPADRAGVRAGDLIVAVNGKDVRGADPARRVVELLSGVKPGDQVDLSVLRDGKARDFTVTAGPDIAIFSGGPIQLPRLPVPPVPPFRALSGWGGGPVIIRGPVADMELVRLTPGLGRYFGTHSGVLVVRAPPDGALGLQDGDVILSIGGRKPIDSSHVIRILASYDPGEKITLEVLRLHHRISVATTMPAEPAMPRGVFMIGGGEGSGSGPVVTLRTRNRTL